MEGKYLSPKADLTFKKIFGEHENLVMSLLNALLPLEPDGQIECVEYLTPEMVPENPGKKNSIVDVRCRDQKGRQFIVEMQMDWNNDFQQRVILNASKAVVSQLKQGEDYHLVKPVYSLNLINDVGFDAGPDEFYHDYAVVDVEHTNRRIEGLRFIFVELPKFKPQNIAEKKMAVLWLRFLTEIDGATMEAPAELLENPETRQALEILEIRAYNEAQIYAYERYWDAVSSDKTRYNSGYRTGHEVGKAEGRAEGRIEGRIEGRAEGKAEGRAEGEHDMASTIVKRMKAKGKTVVEIADLTGLTIDEIEKIQ